MSGSRERGLPCRWAPLRSLLVLCLFLLTACADNRRENASAIATHAGLQRVTFDTGAFVLVGFLKGANSGQPTLITYIEGDGLAWLSRYTLSSDPTPRQPTALELAATDPSVAVLYLGRPCQYVDAADARLCGPQYWSTRRFAPEVITATNQAIDDAKRRVGARAMVLVGYSGGGAVAALAAARRSDVAAWATVAAPIDQAAWTRFHGVSPLTGSLDPIDDASRLARLPQIHFVGAQDTVVPPEIVRSFLEREGPEAQNRLVVVPDADHYCCWVAHWPELRSLIPAS